jgi:hypothetical protein
MHDFPYPDDMFLLLARLKTHVLQELDQLLGLELPAKGKE